MFYFKVMHINGVRQLIKVLINFITSDNFNQKSRKKIKNTHSLQNVSIQSNVTLKIVLML